MRITVDVDDRKLRDILKVTGIKKKSPAINHVLDEYLRESKLRMTLKKVRDGAVDYSLTNEELELGWDDDSD